MLSLYGFRAICGIGTAGLRNKSPARLSNRAGLGSFFDDAREGFQMASTTQVQTRHSAFAPADCFDCFEWLDGDHAPRDEARGLFVLIRGDADSVESVRELIAVPPEIEAVLCLYAKRHPEDARGIERVLKFRKRVREEFGRLVRKSERPLNQTIGVAEPECVSVKSVDG